MLLSIPTIYYYINNGLHLTKSTVELSSLIFLDLSVAYDWVYITLFKILSSIHLYFKSLYFHDFFCNLAEPSLSPWLTFKMIHVSSFSNSVLFVSLSIFTPWLFYLLHIPTYVLPRVSQWWEIACSAEVMNLIPRSGRSILAWRIPWTEEPGML